MGRAVLDDPSRLRKASGNIWEVFTHWVEIAFEHHPSPVGRNFSLAKRLNIHQIEPLLAMMTSQARFPQHADRGPLGGGDPDQSSPLPRGDAGRPLTVRAFAEAADTTPRRIRRLIRQGRLVTTENQAGEVRIPEGELKRVLAWKERRALNRSMEMSRSMEMAVSVEMDAVATKRDDPIRETYSMQIPLQRHEAAMMRLGYLEAELATCKKVLVETSAREEQNRARAEKLDEELRSLKLRNSETENRLEEMRSQTIDSTFRAIELQDEMKQLKERLNSSWWSRFLEALRVSKPGV